MKKPLPINMKFGIVLIVCLAYGHVWSQTAATWNFNNTLNPTNGAHITATAMALSATTAGSFNGGTEYYGEGGWPAAAADPSVYLQFSVSSNTGYSLALNSVTMQLRRSTTGTAAGSGPMNWTLRSSLDNYATDLSSGSLTTSYAPYTVTLPAAFQTIASSVSFRLYGYNMVVTTGGNNRFVFDNITAQGQAVSGTLAEQAITMQVTPGQQNNMQLLRWNIVGFASGTNLSVERSADGTNFSIIYQQQTTTMGNAAYQFEDMSVPFLSKIYYRISATQPDGQHYESAIAMVQENGSQEMQIRGIVSQGAGNSVRALLTIPGQGAYQLILYSSDGKALSRKMLSGAAGSQATDITFGSNPHGIYILTLSDGLRSSTREFVY